MARRVCTVAILLTLTVVLSGCLAGPSPLRRKVDDLQNRNYEQAPLSTAFFSDVFPVYTFMKFGGSFVDVTVINFVQFWGHDLWSDGGTAHTYRNPQGIVKIWPWLHDTSQPSGEDETYSGP